MKIDTSKIDGYAEMTAEDKLKALEEYEIETPKDNSEEINKLKASLSKANSDAAEWKRQFREKQSEQERAEAERAEREKAVEDELRTLRRDKTVSGYLA
jgi:chromosome segregation ATPase